jgi:chromosome segregation ATPase
VHSLETQAGFASRDKEAAVEALTALRTERDTLLSQQTHWEDLRRTTEQLELLSALVTQAQTNEPELKELRRRSKVLEGDYADLQRRYKEQEVRLTSSDRAASSARERATEWEERAIEHENALSEVQAAREDAEDRVAQLVDDYDLVKMQLEDKDAEERLAKVRPSSFVLV